MFGMPPEKGRWVFIPLGIGILLCLGTVYSWSIFRTPLEDLWKIGATESLLPFTVLLVVNAMLMPITGFYIDRLGARKIATIGGLIMGLGYILSSFATSVPMLVVTYGAIAGAGVGITYGVPIAVCAKWFPDRKGLAVGLTVIGFGLSPLITAPLARSAIAAYGLMPSFAILGIAFTAIILAISTLLKVPPKGWKPSGWQPTVTNNRTLTRDNSDHLLRSPEFYGLWLCYTIGTFVGLSAIGISSSVAQEIIKLDSAVAAMTVSLFAVFNGLGRPLFGWLTDRIRPQNAAIASYVLILIGSIIMIHASQGQTISYLVAFSLFWLSLGGWLAIAPTATLTLFTPENYPKNYGIVFTAYGVGALLGTTIAGRIRDIFGTYSYTFYATAALAIVGIIIAELMLKHHPKTTEPARVGKHPA